MSCWSGSGCKVMCCWGSGCKVMCCWGSGCKVMCRWGSGCKVMCCWGSGCKVMCRWGSGCKVISGGRAQCYQPVFISSVFYRVCDRRLPCIPLFLQLPKTPPPLLSTNYSGVSAICLSSADNLGCFPVNVQGMCCTCIVRFSLSP
uniref:Uncharacterized protein n=1 Tax=Paramormyrops kingsleyae TaxID=1676925 RepID=A0A3B3QXG9_9TELE